MDKLIIDGMEKESKVSMYLMVIGYIFAVLILLISYKSKDKDDVLLAIMWFIIGTFGLYTWLCAIKYKIEINSKTSKRKQFAFVIISVHINCIITAISFTL